MALSRSPIESYELLKVSRLSSLLNNTDIQRVINQNRVDEMYISFLKDLNKGKEIVSPGTLILGELDNTLYLLDGQHRFQAYLKLLNEEKYDQTLMTNTIKLNSEEEMRVLFNTINESVPVAQIPAGISRKDSNTIVKHFLDKYPNIFSNSRSGTVQRPHLHPTKFEEQIVKLLQIYSGEVLLQKLEELNLTLKNSNIRQFKVNQKDTEDKLETLRNKATIKGGLYFGIFPHYECFEGLYPRMFLRYRKSVPAMLRDRIWSIYHGKSEKGECPFCSLEITKKTCHLAHDLAHAKGGDATIENLYPCCSSCNLTMGVLSYEEVIKILKKN